VAKMSGQNIAYIRVSSVQQNTGRQLEGLIFDETFTEKVSAKDTKRPQLQACLTHLRKDDVLHVHSLDRLARNLSDLEKLVTELNRKGVTVHFHKENLVFSGEANPMQTLMLQMFGAFAQFERSLIKERQAEGIAVALKNNVKFGRAPKLDAEQIAELKDRAANHEDKSRLAKEFGISRPTLYKMLA
jgi:DNA invertase Pin-like site-specific DNA recombinase